VKALRSSFQKETSHMKWTATVTLLASTIMGLSNASAQTATKATIPFSFHAGSTSMPAGVYKLECARSGVLSLYQEGENAHVSLLATTSTGSTAPPERIVFTRYGNQYFLRATLKYNGAESMTFKPSKLEKEIQVEEAGLSPDTQILVASK